MKRQATRRSFLTEMAAGAAVLPGALALPGSLALPGALSGQGLDPRRRELPPDGPRSPRDEPYWELVRAQFSFTEESVPMNAANLCPSPRSVAARVEDLTRDIDRDCSFNNRAKFRDLTEQSRAAVAAQLGVSPDEIAIVRNTSEANNTINNGVPLTAGDEVVLWDQNHPTNNVAWDVRAARFGIMVKRVSVPRHPASIQELIDPFVAALTERTRVLSLTHVSNVSGIRLPVRELVEAARPRGVHVHWTARRAGAPSMSTWVRSAATRIPPPLTSGSWARRRRVCSTSGRPDRGDLAQHRGAPAGATTPNPT